ARGGDVARHGERAFAQRRDNGIGARRIANVDGHARAALVQPRSDGATQPARRSSDDRDAPAEIQRRVADCFVTCVVRLDDGAPLKSRQYGYLLPGTRAMRSMEPTTAILSNRPPGAGCTGAGSHRRAASEANASECDADRRSA